LNHFSHSQERYLLQGKPRAKSISQECLFNSNTCNLHAPKTRSFPRNYYSGFRVKIADLQNKAEKI